MGNLQEEEVDFSDYEDYNDVPSQPGMVSLPFEGLLDTIERDDYILRAEYNERRKFSAWLRMAWLCVSVTLRHIVRRGRRDADLDGRSKVSH